MFINYAPLVENQNDNWVYSWDYGIVYAKLFIGENKIKRAEIHADNWELPIDGAYVWEKYEAVRNIKSDPDAFQVKVDQDDRLDQQTRKALQELCNHAQN